MIKRTIEVFDYPKNLIFDIIDSHRGAGTNYFDINYAIEHFEENWKFLLESEPELLTTKVQLILKLYYMRNMTLIDIGKELGVSGTRIKQVVVKIISTLARPHYIGYLFVGKDVIMQEATLKKEYADLLNSYATKVEELKKKIKNLKDIATLEDLMRETDVLEKSIDTLELSVRVRNCLMRSKINTIGILMEYTLTDLAKVRSLGQKGISQIVEQLARIYGMRLKRGEGF